MKPLKLLAAEETPPGGGPDARFCDDSLDVLLNVFGDVLGGNSPM
jgi:hypothetical protein